jgi:hypothetical protein
MLYIASLNERGTTCEERAVREVDAPRCRGGKYHEGA